MCFTFLVYLSELPCIAFVTVSAQAVFQEVKDTILKAIHNHFCENPLEVFAVFQEVKDTILKAIHNSKRSASSRLVSFSVFCKI